MRAILKIHLEPMSLPIPPELEEPGEYVYLPGSVVRGVVRVLVHRPTRFCFLDAVLERLEERTENHRHTGIPQRRSTVAFRKSIRIAEDVVAVPPEIHARFQLRIPEDAPPSFYEHRVRSNAPIWEPRALQLLHYDHTAYWQIRVVAEQEDGYFVEHSVPIVIPPVVERVGELTEYTFAGRSSKIYIRLPSSCVKPASLLEGLVRIEKLPSRCRRATLELVLEERKRATRWVVARHYIPLRRSEDLLFSVPIPAWLFPSKGVDHEFETYLVLRLERSFGLDLEHRIPLTVAYPRSLFEQSR